MKIVRKPEWLQKRITPGAHAEMERLLGDLRLHTVCQEALCPNISECFRQKQATFLILGSACTRLCTFCNVRQELPLPVDASEPEHVAEAVVRLGLAHLVITSPTRDDLTDGGASHYAATVREIRRQSPETRIELLVPDFQGSRDSLATVLAAGPDILGHNLETVPRLYHIRKGADYHRSLELLGASREIAPSIPTKSGIMLGLGETLDEVRQVMVDLCDAGCRYLAPSRTHQQVVEFIPPEIFEKLRTEALNRGFSHVESGPYVRSSYHADQYPRTGRSPTEESSPSGRD
jgi:lipoic acid synthetase